MSTFAFTAISVVLSVALDCKRFKREGDGGSVYCGGDMSSTGFDGTTDRVGKSSTSGSGGDGGANGGGD